MGFKFLCLFKHHFTPGVNHVSMLKTQPHVLYSHPYGSALVYNCKIMIKVNLWWRYAIDVLAKTRLAAALGGGILGAVFFLLYYGAYCINPSNTDWLLNAGDLEQHYTGWAFFRESAWTFPIGMIEGLAYPFGIPITYVDSIPLFAIFFKLLDPILPDTFQYFGIWGIMCFVLQGGLGALIVRKFSPNLSVALTGSLLFIMNPILLSRMFTHTALAANWLILVGIILMLHYRRVAALGEKWVVLIWGALLTIAVLIHPYYLPMLFVFLAAYILLTYTSLRRLVTSAIVPVLVMGVGFWLIGGFALDGSSSAGGLDKYGFNLASLTNPLGWSNVLISWPIGVQSLETLNYLGLGILLLGAGAVTLFIFLRYDKAVIKAFIENKRLWFVVAVFVLLIVASLGSIVRYQEFVLADLTFLPDRLLQKWAIFRSSGRLFWPIYYLIITGILAIILVAFTRRKVGVMYVLLLISIAVGIQYAELVRSPPGVAQQSVVDDFVVRSASEDRILQYANDRSYNQGTKKLHMMYVGAMEQKDFFNLNEMAINHGLTMNTGYFARAPHGELERFANEAEIRIQRGEKLDGTTLYVVRRDRLSALNLFSSNYGIDYIAEYAFIYQK